MSFFSDLLATGEAAPEPKQPQAPEPKPKTLTGPTNPPSPGGVLGLRELMAAMGKAPDLSGYRQVRMLQDMAATDIEAPNMRRVARQAKDYLNRLGITGPSDLGGPSSRFQKLAYAKLLSQTAANIANRQLGTTKTQADVLRQLIGTSGSVLGTGLSAQAAYANARNAALRGLAAALAKTNTKTKTSKSSTRDPNKIDYKKWLSVLQGRLGADPVAKVAANTALDAYAQTGREPPPELLALANREFLQKVKDAADNATFSIFRAVPWSDTAMLRKANRGLEASQNPLMSAVASGQWAFDPSQHALVPVGPRFGVEQSDRKPISLDLSDPVQKLIANLFRLRVNGQQ